MSDHINVLDHGYVAYVEHWGSDESIIEAARMSTNKGFQGWGPIYLCPAGCGCKWRENGDGSMSLFPGEKSCAVCEPLPLADLKKTPGDEKLLRFLWEHKHATPFEMAGMVIEVQAPIMVFREWHRHRTQSVNEMSARYTQLPDMFYVPKPERVTAQSKTNKQGSGDEKLPDLIVAGFLESLRYTQEMAYARYEDAIKAGIPRELARLHLPVSIYSRMRAQALLRNWLGFLSLRLDAGAQWEIRQYAEAVGTLIAERFPKTWALFAEGRAPKNERS